MTHVLKINDVIDATTVKAVEVFLVTSVRSGDLHANINSAAGAAMALLDDVNSMAPTGHLFSHGAISTNALHLDTLYFRRSIRTRASRLFRSKRCRASPKTI